MPRLVSDPPFSKPATTDFDSCLSRRRTSAAPAPGSVARHSAAVPTDATPRRHRRLLPLDRCPPTAIPSVGYEPLPHRLVRNLSAPARVGRGYRLYGRP